MLKWIILGWLIGLVLSKLWINRDPERSIRSKMKAIKREAGKIDSLIKQIELREKIIRTYTQQSMMKSYRLDGDRQIEVQADLVKILKVVYKKEEEIK